MILSGPVQDWWIGRQPVAQLQALAARRPGDTRVRYFLTLALLHGGQAEAAWQQAREGILGEATLPMGRRGSRQGEAALPAGRRRSREGDARLHRAAGLAAVAAGRVEEAASCLGRARELGDADPGLYHGLAQVEMARGHTAEALLILEQCLRRRPDDAEAWDLTGRCRGALGMPKQWIEAAERATRLRPREVRYRMSQAEAHLSLGDAPAAVSAALHATDLAPKNRAAWAMLGRAMGWMARSVSSVADADTAFRNAITDELPGSPPPVALAEYGKHLVQHGSPEFAIPYLTRALKAAPADASVIYTLALAARRTGRVSQARMLIREFEQITAETRRIHTLRARITANPHDAAARRELGTAAGATVKSQTPPAPPASP